MARKKHRSFRPASGAPLGPSSQLADQLREVAGLIDRGRYARAKEVLDDLEKRFPNNLDVVQGRLAFAQEVNDGPLYVEMCERAVALRPDDPEWRVRLAAAYLANNRRAQALLAFAALVKRWPSNPLVERARPVFAEVEQTFLADLPRSQFAGDNALEAAALHEQTMAALARFDFAQARRTAEQLLAVRPTFIPAWNNAAESCFFLDDARQAVALSRGALSFDPNNVHARSNLTRHLYLSGHAEEAAVAARQLRALTPGNLTGWVKMAEALSYLGDDAVVLETVARARAGLSSPAEWAGEHAAALEHLAAAAAYRQGNESEARRLWESALRHCPDFEPARSSLDDLKQPVEARHAGWSYTLPHWLPEKTSVYLRERIFQGNEGPERTEQCIRAARQALADRPDVAALIPHLLDRGDREGRFWALHMAMMVKTPAMLEALRDFALSRRGPDEQRQMALNEAMQAHLTPERLRFWFKGEWHEVEPGMVELHNEPSFNHPIKVAALAEQGDQLMRAGQASRAEPLYRQAVAWQPDAPDLRYNLAVCWLNQGRQAEGEAALREIHERFPDYLLATVGVARLEVMAGRLDRAAKLLAPVKLRGRMRAAEFASLAMVKIELALARGDREEARVLAQMWAQLMPDHPYLATQRDLLQER